MSSTRDTLRAAVQQMFGDKWEVIDSGPTMLLRCNDVREIPVEWWDTSSVYPHAFVERIRRLHREMVGAIDPEALDRLVDIETKRSELRAKLTKAEAELAGAKAIIADLFRQAREGAKP